MKLCIIGCGNMGLIYAHYFTQQHIVKKEDLLLIEKNESRRQELQLKNIGAIELTRCRAIEQIDFILLAVKPQDFDEVALQLRGRLHKDCLVISIMAGVTIQSICEKLQTNDVVRAMPNAPALYGQGMTVYFCSSDLTAEQKKRANLLLSVTGKIEETQREDFLNAVTAISGSGPAYFFYLAQQMIKQAIVLGIDAKTAEILVKQTLLGAAVMLDQSEKTCSDLVKTVASKGGTTEAALNVFEENKLPDIIAEALQRATNRSVELAMQ